MKELHIPAKEFQLHAEDNGETQEVLKILEDCKSVIRRRLYLQGGEWITESKANGRNICEDGYTGPDNK